MTEGDKNAECADSRLLLCIGDAVKVDVAVVGGAKLSIMGVSHNNALIKSSSSSSRDFKITGGTGLTGVFCGTAGKRDGAEMLGNSMRWGYAVMGDTGNENSPNDIPLNSMGSMADGGPLMADMGKLSRESGVEVPLRDAHGRNCPGIDGRRLRDP